MSAEDRIAVSARLAGGHWRRLGHDLADGRRDPATLAALHEHCAALAADAAALGWAETERYALHLAALAADGAPEMPPDFCQIIASGLIGWAEGR